MAERKQRTDVQPEQEAPRQAPASPVAGPQAEQATPPLPDLTCKVNVNLAMLG